jgi:hypothetical protein
MLVTNNTSTYKVLHYKVNGQRKSVRIPGQSSVNLPDLQYHHQILHNNFDLKIERINDFLSRDLRESFIEIDNSARGFYNSFVFRTIDLDTNTPVNLVMRDGSQLVYYENKLHLIGGWNTVAFSSTNDSTNEHWVNETPEDPTTWVQLANAPFDGVHVFGCVVANGYIWKFGNDGQNPGKTSYKYSEAGGWVLVSASMTGDWGDRYVAAYCYHQGYFYAAGGVTGTPGSYLTNVIRSSDCVDWTAVGNLPDGFYLGSILVSDGTSLYFWGGGLYLSTGQDAILKSSDGGFNWTNIGTLPVGMRGTYTNGAYFEGKFWHLNGYNVSNQRGLYYTSDFITWTQLYDNPVETHASAFGVGGDKLYRITGNMDNYMYSVSGIADPENTISTGAVAIYSIRNHENFVGSYAMEVQRSSDNNTLNIGFIGNDIDEVAMTTFMGAGDLYVSKWYDRSGNGNHATNTLGNRPRIGSSGVLDKINGKVAIYHSSGSVRLVFNNQIDLLKEHTVFSVIRFDASDREFIGGGGNTYLVYRGAASSGFNAGGSNASGFNTLTLSTQTLLTDNRSGRIYTRFLNGYSAPYSKLVGVSNNDFIITNLSGESDPIYNFIGYMQEVIIYANDKLEQKAGIEENINEYYSIF